MLVIYMGDTKVVFVGYLCIQCTYSTANENGLWTQWIYPPCQLARSIYLENEKRNEHRIPRMKITSQRVKIWSPPSLYERGILLEEIQKERHHKNQKEERAHLFPVNIPSYHLFDTTNSELSKRSKKYARCCIAPRRQEVSPIVLTCRQENLAVHAIA